MYLRLIFACLVCSLLASVAIAGGPTKGIRGYTFFSSGSVLKSGSTLNSGAIIDMNAGYIYDSTDSLAVGGACTLGISGDTCVNGVLYVDGVVTTGVITAQDGMSLSDGIEITFGDFNYFWFLHATGGTHGFRLRDKIQGTVFLVLSGTDIVRFVGEVTVNGVTGSQNIICVKANGQFGTCSGGVVVGGTCTCG